MAATLGMAGILTLLGLDSAFIVTQIISGGTAPKSSYKTHA